MRRPELPFLLLLAVLTLLVYLPTLNHELIWDSKPVIEENALLKGNFAPLAPFQSGYWATTSQRSDRGYDYYRPVMILSFMVEKTLWGLSPFRLRLTNLALFIAALFVLYFFLLRQTPNAAVAKIATLIYALFPIHLDNITWVVGRCDLLMLLFGMLSLLWFDHFLEKRTLLPALLALSSFSLALFSKEAALFFLPMFPLHELIRHRRLSLSPYIPPLLVTLGFWLVKSSVIGRSGIPMRLFPTLWENVHTILGGLGYYARSLAFPFRVDMFLPMAAVQSISYLIPGAILALFISLVPWLGRQRNELLLSWFWIAPFLGGVLLMVFTPIYPFSISTRYLMIPAIGWTWLLAHWSFRLPRKTQRILITLLLIAFGSTVLATASRYQNELTFWQNALQGCPHDNFFLHKTAQQLLNQEDLLSAEPLFRQALSGRLNPATAASIALNLADLKFRQAHYSESEHWLSQAGLLPLNPPQTWNRWSQLIRLHQARGELAAVEQSLQEILRRQSPREGRLSKVQLYISFAEWERARNSLGDIIAQGREPEATDKINRLERSFQSMRLQERADFFQQRGNFAFAWDLLRQEQSNAIADRLKRIRAALLAGKEEDGQQLIASLADQGRSDYRLLNSLGTILFDLHRATEALPLYRKSLLLHPDQPALRERTAWIEARIPRSFSDLH